MNVIEAIERKRAVRRYRDEALPEDVVRAILRAGRRAQSSKNSQPWSFIAVRDKETLVKLAQMGDFASHLPSAAMCVVILTPDPQRRWSVMFDAGQAAAYMQLAALELGVGSCLVTFHRPDGGRELLGFPEERHMNGGITFGYPEDQEQAFAPAAKPGGRREVDEVIHFERW